MVSPESGIRKRSDDRHLREKTVRSIYYPDEQFLACQSGNG